MLISTYGQDVEIKTDELKIVELKRNYFFHLVVSERYLKNRIIICE